MRSVTIGAIMLCMGSLLLSGAPAPDALDAPAPASPPPDPRAAGKALMADGNYEEAEQLFAEVAAGSQGEEAAEALFQRGECLRALKRHEEALECYAAIPSQRPSVELLKRSLERRYQLGLDFLQGNAHRYFLGIIPYTSSAFGVKVLDDLVREFPFESFSADALYSIASHYFRQEEWEECRPVYERLIEKYPTSELTPPAHFQLGKAVYSTVKGYRYDLRPLAEARRYFERFLERRPVGAEAEEARRYIRELRQMEAQHELYVARFYLGNDCRRGADIHLRAAVRKGTGADGELVDAAKEAQEELAKLQKQGDEK
jgi:outer membrane assembly lipoprotein YfiO